MRTRIIALGLLLIGACWTPASDASPPSTLRDVSVSSRVNKIGQTGVYAYHYRVSNPPRNDGEIRSIDIEISRASDEAILSREGLVNGPRYSRHSSEDAFQRVPMVPVGISGPEGWTPGLGFDAQPPPRGFAGWGSIEESFRILPGQSREGFQMTSYGPPGIRQVRIEPSVEPPEGVGDWKELNTFYSQFTFRTMTVGPKAPPQTFVPLEFLNYLISLVYDSRQQGWVREAKEAKKLLQDLLKAKRRLEAGDPGKARSALKEFLERVKHEGCRDFHCPKGKALTSEAYALLYFNGKFLQAKLPKPPGDRDDDRDDD